MKCYYHKEIDSLISCKQCEIALCLECRNEEYIEYCHACALDYRNKEYDKTQKSYRKHDWQLSNDKWLRYIGWYEIIGGVVGILTILMVILQFQMLNLVSICLIAGFFFLYILSIVSGVLLLKNKASGTILSVCLQVLQVPQLMIHGITYVFISGASLAIKFVFGSETAIGLNFWILSKFQFSFTFHNTPFLISINIIPLLILVIFHKKKQLLNS
ncbi:hypothetical protein GK047_02480 [Paenibacillus sp. SYP-B3998]|uniref:B box-type domain-containing protein n=1 Tax=Paenibacillus sp. SYP-B3998 TaxID=2678564 RepID=A0A6G3ZRY8_9BACL|nr:hypothetical protein [Paenibacillus sp. SYP-B3998]NEW04885.1 hypothetical protein [Paenibacillus sp. SYP-B3998]